MSLLVMGATAYIGPGFGCVYEETLGSARVTSVSPSTDSSCPSGGAEVRFDFIPADAAKASLAISGVRLTVGTGYDPARTWVDASGLSVGSVHPAKRMDERSGGCSPREVILTDLDLEKGASACFGK
jgi:hypothetical protein